MLFRLPAVLQMKFRAHIAEYKLFCTFEGKRCRVTGASRLGDVWLSHDFSRDVGYEMRVDINNCSDWSSTP